LTGVSLNSLDNNDTLQVFGVGAHGVLELIGYDGLVSSGLAGGATFVNTAANNNTTVLSFVAPGAYYKDFVLTSPVDGRVQAQAFRFSSITLAAPELQTWALMLSGFGMVGVVARRRKAVAAARSATTDAPLPRWPAERPVGRP
jgi:hypothetical protein